MTMDEREHFEYHRQASEGWQQHVARMRKNDLLGPDYRFSCVLSPGDTLLVRRQGAKGLDSSYANVVMTIHGETAGAVMLSAAATRRLAAALLDIADEIEPYVKGTATDDLMGGER